MQIDVFTLFPESFDWFKGQRHVRNALGAGHELRLFDIRATTPLSHGQVDDTPYGGGAGMVIRVDVMDAALRAAYGDDTEAMLDDRRVCLLTPAGRTLDEERVTELSGCERLTLLCGRYEGIDDRVRGHLSNCAISIGRYVLSGGELAAMVVIDAVIRKLPGSLGDSRSAAEESFSPRLGGKVEYPHFTRPATYRGWSVPGVLQSGNHAEIAAWRRAQLDDAGRGGEGG